MKRVSTASVKSIPQLLLCNKRDRANEKENNRPLVWSRGDPQVARSKNIAVVDASVVVKWFNAEDYTTNALSLLNDYSENRLELLAPYLLVYEVGNALRYNSDFGEADVRESISYLGIFG